MGNFLAKNIKFLYATAFLAVTPQHLALNICVGTEHAIGKMFQDQRFAVVRTSTFYTFVAI